MSRLRWIMFYKEGVLGGVGVFQCKRSEFPNERERGLREVFFFFFFF